MRATWLVELKKRGRARLLVIVDLILGTGAFVYVSYHCVY